MTLGDTASESDYTFETICALYVRELASRPVDYPTVAIFSPN